jgi:hypothetical protein
MVHPLSRPAPRGWLLGSVRGAPGGANAARLPLRNQRHAAADIIVLNSAGLLRRGFNLTGRMRMPRQVRAVVVDPAAPGKLAIKPVELRDPDRDELAVRVTAISLNRGETRRAVQRAEPGWRPGWDFAGVTETAATDGSGPRSGTRVVGILPSSAWAERVNCRTQISCGPRRLGSRLSPRNC